jgi:hypothetical protein
MPQARLRAALSIQDWVQGLASISSQQFTQQNLLRYFHDHAIDHSTLAPYSFFSSQRYARNLIFKNDLFECLALCWDVGQSSSIHDHNNKLGWIYLVEGQLFVQNYVVQARDPARHTCRVVPTSSAELSADNAAYVDHDQAVHKVSNLSKYGGQAISVHVYEQPLSQCEIYSLENGTYEVIQLAYTSEFGRLSPSAKL